MLPEDSQIPFVLVGQFGKYICETNQTTENISSFEMFQEVLNIVIEANKLIPCRVLLVECSDNSKVHQVYEKLGFSYFQNDGEHNQFYYKVRN